MSYYFETPIGVAEITFVDDRWLASFAGQRIATYHSPIDAAAYLHEACITSGTTEISLSSYHIPDNLSEWHRRTNYVNAAHSFSHALFQHEK